MTVLYVFGLNLTADGFHDQYPANANVNR